MGKEEKREKKREQRFKGIPKRTKTKLENKEKVRQFN